MGGTGMSRKTRIALAAFVLGLLITGYVVWHGRTRHRHRPSKVTSGNRVDWRKLGMRAYPGAQLLRGHTIEGETHFTIMADLHTPDDFDTVARFYRGEYPSPQTTRESGGGGTPRVLELAIGSYPDSRNVTVREDRANGVTVVLLQHSTDAGPPPAPRPEGPRPPPGVSGAGNRADMNRMRIWLASCAVGLLVLGYVVWRVQTRHRHRPPRVTSRRKG